MFHSTFTNHRAVSTKAIEAESKIMKGIRKYQKSEAKLYSIRVKRVQQGVADVSVVVTMKLNIKVGEI